MFEYLKELNIVLIILDQLVQYRKSVFEKMLDLDRRSGMPSLACVIDI